MKLLADECCSADLVYALREDGYDVVYATEELRGASDSEILAKAFDEERVLLTEDKDFGELVRRLSRPSRGIIFLRFPKSVRLAKIRRLRDLLQQHQERSKDHTSCLNQSRLGYGASRSHQVVPAFHEQEALSTQLTALTSQKGPIHGAGFSPVDVSTCADWNACLDHSMSARS